MKKIIAVCTANTCRSPMAEAFLRDALLRNGVEGYEVASAGVFAFDGAGATEEAVEALREYGLDLTKHRARRLEDVYTPGAILLCMTNMHLMSVRDEYPEAEAELYMRYASLPGEVPDPYAMGISTYRRAAGEIMAAAEKIAQRLGGRQGNV